MLLGTTILAGQERPPTWDPGLGSIVLLLVFFGLTFLLIFRTLRLTSVASASESAGAPGARLARRGGKRFARLQLMTDRLQEIARDDPNVQVFTSPDESATRHPVRAQRSGFLQLRHRRLRKVLSRQQWRESGARFDLNLFPGRAVVPGQEVASVVPLASSTLDDRIVSRLERSLRVDEEKALERFAELCSALTLQIPGLVRAGDPAGARRVIDVLLRLLQQHQSVLVPPRKGETRPVSPAMLYTVELAAAAMRNAQSEAERDLLSQLLGALIDRANRHDGTLFLISAKIGQQPTTLSEYGVLYAIAQRAIVLGSNEDLLAAQDSFKKVVDGTAEAARYANEVAGRIVLYSAIVAPRLSRRAWSRWSKACPSAPESDRVRIAARIGAGALTVGNFSLATEVALSINADFARLTESVREQSHMEKFLSDSYGRLLGNDAEQRLVTFLSFAENVRQTVDSEADDPAEE
jgi:hypothetical protein